MKDNSNISQDLLETIERYYNDSIASGERVVFEKKLQNDPEFKTQVEDIKTLLLGIETQALKEQLNDFHKDIKKTEKNTKVRFLTFRKFAAAAIIIAFGSFLFFNKPANEKLYAKYFKPDPGLPTTMSNTEDFKFYDAMVNYKRGDYTLAIEKWESLLSHKPQNDTLNYFVGVAYLADKNEKTSIPYLEKTVQQTNSVFKNEAFYYLGLAYLKVDNIQLAKENFIQSTINNSEDIISELND